MPAFCVQYHPEAAPGPHDSRYLFDEFRALMGRRGGLMPRRTDIRTDHGDRLGPDRDRAGLRVRLLGHAGVQGAAREGFEVALVNSNPATIMTDPEFADRTYIEPLTPESVLAICERERPDALLPTLGGQTALNVAVALAESGRPRPPRHRG